MFIKKKCISFVNEILKTPYNIDNVYIRFIFKDTITFKCTFFDIISDVLSSIFRKYYIIHELYVLIISLYVFC